MRQALLAAALLLALGCCVASAAYADESDLTTSDLQATEGEVEPELKQYYEVDGGYPYGYGSRRRRRSGSYFRPEWRSRRSSGYFRPEWRSRRSSGFRRHLRSLLRQLLADKDSASTSASESDSRSTSAEGSKRGRGRRLFRRLRSLARLLDGLTRETAACKLSDRIGKSLTKWAGRLKPFLAANSTLTRRTLRATEAPATSVATADGEEFY